MKITRGHTFNLDFDSLQSLEIFLPRLKYSLSPTKIIKWLENFKESDLSEVYDFLQVFEYISFPEMQYRLESLLKDIFLELDDKEKAIVFPYGKFGKSSTLVSYPLTHTPYYMELENKGRISIKNSFQNLNVEDYDCIIFLDDFIGSGKTFCDKYIDEGFEKWITSKKAMPKVYLLATIIMAKGKEKINQKFNYIKVKAQERKKIFDINYSPLKVFGKLSDYSSLNQKYENSIPVSKNYKRGFKKSESLIAFAHGTPNNTIPIIWWDENWTPLFPRHANTRMEDAKRIKKEAAFYIGICNKLKIDLENLQKHKGKFDKFYKKNNSRASHSIIVFLKLKIDKIDDYIISHIIGLSDDELNNLYSTCRKRGFIDEEKNITSNGFLYIKLLEKSIAKEKTKDLTNENLTPKEFIYLPKTFKGWT